MIEINKRVLENMIGDIDFLQSQMAHMKNRVKRILESEERMYALKSGNTALYDELCKKHGE